MSTHPIIIIGAGPAGLMAAQQLAENGFSVHIYEQNKAAARKFLVAGHGGFNLTHDEAIDDFVLKYDKTIIQDIVKHFDNKHTVKWLSQIGISTYVGSSGKIFPAKNIKPIQVLQAWLDYLDKIKVKIHYNHKLIDFTDKEVILMHGERIIKQQFDNLILALGGGSWKKTGSNAEWMDLLKRKNIATTPLEAANSGYNCVHDFSELEGQILKNIEVSFNNFRKKGELVFTNYGIEGSPIYYLNRFTRLHPFPLTINIDLKPNFSEEKLTEILSVDKKVSAILKEKLHLNKTAISLLKSIEKTIYMDPKALAKTIKSYPLQVKGLRPIDEVISTAGGVSFDALNPSLSFKEHPQIYCVGEMLDWEAPTGGYLLQACFSTGYWAAHQIIASYISGE